VQAGGEWTEQAPPTLRELERFVIERLKNIGDVFTEEFVDQCFHKLWQHGRLFFLFDSFDEIPELLDSSEESWLIESLSTLFTRFIASSPQSRGILASRMFRRPTSAYLAEKVLEIRPLTEESIINALSRHPEFTEAIKLKLFRDRPDLVPVARNPLLASLLGEWVQTHRDLPAHQADLYRDYLLNRLKQCSARIETKGLSIQQVLDIAQGIAWFVFESPAYGLEAPVQVLTDQTISPHTDAVIDILSYARVARVTTMEPKSFAFSHRRFLEYFVTTKLLSTPDRLPTEHIPTDSRGRDALTLYAQVCDEQSASQLAEFCWKEIQENFDSPTQKLRAIHSLRFLIDAFRMRRDSIETFSSMLHHFIYKSLQENGNLIQAKVCLEATGLISDEEALPLLRSAMMSRNSWLEETAFRACRQLPNIDPSLKELLIDYILKISIFHLWKNRSHFDFVLSLSNRLYEVKKIAKLRAIGFAASILAILASFILAPSVSLIIFALSPCFIFLIEIVSNFENRRQRTASRAITDSITTERHSFYEKTIDLARNFIPVLLITDASFFLSGISNGFERRIEPEYLLIIQHNKWIYFGIYFLLAFLIFDWAKAWIFKRKLFPYLSLSYAVDKIPSLLIASLIFGFIIFLFDYITGIYPLSDLLPITEFISVSAGFFTIFIVVLFLKKAVAIILFEIEEYRAFSSIEVFRTMPREKIVSELSSLTSDRRRVAFVRRLGTLRVSPTGDWPATFHFSITNDPALTELAKLEERWLGLDR
jgi:hypothetical protein